MRQCRSVRMSVVAALCFIGCASQTQIPIATRAALSIKHVGNTVELNQSCYFGDLYDENEMWLLSPRPFPEIHHLVDTSGAPIHPPGQRGIVPAGTKFMIVKVEFPDPFALAKRMLTSPRYNTWIYLVPRDAMSAIAQLRKYYVLLLPTGLKSQHQFEMELAKLVTPGNRTSQWLTQLKPTTRAAIAHKDMISGMTRRQLVASMGEPVRWFPEYQGSTKHMVAWYPSREAWLEDDRVVSIKKSREIKPRKSTSDPVLPGPEPAVDGT